MYLLEFLDGGLMQLRWWQLILAALVLTHITIASVTIFLHRSQAHRALDLHPAAAMFFRVWLWLLFTASITPAWRLTKTRTARKLAASKRSCGPVPSCIWKRQRTPIR